MAGAMRIDPVEETEDVDDQFEMSLEYLPDPVQCVEPPQMVSHAATGEERGSAGLRMRMEEGLTPGGYRYRTRSRTGSLGCGKLMPPSNESKRGKNEVISETEAGGGDGTVKSAAQYGSVKIVLCYDDLLARKIQLRKSYSLSSISLMQLSSIVLSKQATRARQRTCL